MKEKAANRMSLNGKHGSFNVTRSDKIVITVCLGVNIT